MSMWTTRLDAAGIHDPQLREDFTRQRSLVARYKRAAYIAVLLLLPRPLAPHLIAATAFMHHTDNLLDRGPLSQRAAAFTAWEEEVNQAIATGASDHPVIRPLLHTGTCHPRLLGHVQDFLRTAATDLEFTGFATESDYQRYLDDYSLPAFLLVACLLVPGDEPAGYRAACRTYIDGSQRLDFVNDLAEDLADDRLTIPQDTLLRHGVTRTDLVRAQDTPGVRALLRHLLQQARTDLAASHRVTGFLPPANRPFVQALIALEEATTDAAGAKGPGLLTAPARPAVPAMLKILTREYRHARSLRGSRAEALINELFEERVDALAAFAEQALTHDDPWEGFVSLLTMALELMAADRGLREVVFSEVGGRPHVARARRKFVPASDAVMRRAQDAGLLRPDLATTDLPMIFYMVSCAIQHTQPVSTAVWRRYLTIVLDGLRVRPGLTDLPVVALTTAEEEQVSGLSPSGS